MPPPRSSPSRPAPAYAKYGSEKPGGDNGKDNEWYEDKDEKKKDSEDKGDTEKEKKGK